MSQVIHDPRSSAATDRLKYLGILEERVLWLSMWMIHHANHLRPKRDGLKVGGHQASSSSVVTLMTALYFDTLRTWDRVAIKPHASPVFHAVQYLFGRQTRENLEAFRAFGGAQSYPSRTKDADDVDFSTGSVGLGVAITSFAALVRDYVTLKGLSSAGTHAGRMIALVGDAELDEGNVFEVLLEGWKHQIRDTWWIIDYNRQSLDTVIPDQLSPRIEHVFRDMDWRVVTLKYGRPLERAFARRGGDALRHWIDECPNSLYSALAYHGGPSWRQHLLSDIGDVSGIRELLDEHDDESLHRLMTNLGGHDLETILDAFHAVTDDRPTCFVAYTIKGFGLPFAGHKDNHSGLMSPAQIDLLRTRLGIPKGDEWEPFSGVGDLESELRAFIASAPFAAEENRVTEAPIVPVPQSLKLTAEGMLSTQEGFGRILAAIAREHGELADHIVTMSPDVTVSTNLGPWVNRRGVFAQHDFGDVHDDAQVASPQKWSVSRAGQHIELGIAENSLFLLLAACGLADRLFAARLLPIGTLYDPFIARGLDALNYACYQDSRFIVAATPSGITLAPEGGAHQSIYTPLIGIGQPGLTAFEPAYVDELCEILRWSFEHLQAEDGGSVYLRLTTRPVEQPRRTLSDERRAQIVDGAYWLVEPDPGAPLAIVASGALVPEALEAQRAIAEDMSAGLLVVTSAQRLQHDWIARQRNLRKGSLQSYIEELLERLAPGAGLVTVCDAHPATLAWLGGVRQHRIIALGVDRFGQSGDLRDLYRTYGIDSASILDAAARLCVQRL
jgi:pyruvate dehydrogenase E1 component